MPVPPDGPTVHPTVDDPVVAALSEPIGGPVGTRARRRGVGGSWWTPLRVLLALTSVAFSLGLATKASCVGEGWSGEVSYSQVCSSEVADAYSGTGLVEGSWPWSAATTDRHPVLEEPALVGLWAYAAARVTHVLSGSPDLGARRDVAVDVLARTAEVRRERTIFVGVNAIGFAALALLTTAALSRVHRRRPWDAAGFAVAPVLVLTGLSAWHLLAVAAAALALLAWSRRRPVLAGLLVGLGTAAGVWPVLLLAAFALSTDRRRTAWSAARVGSVVGAALVTWAVVNAPAFVTGRSQWERSWSVAADRGPDSGTLWTVLDGVVGLSSSTVLLASWVFVALWVAGVAAVALLAPAPPRTSQAALLLVAGFVLLRPAFEPHQALWLLPLAALARPRWRDLLVWNACAVVFTALHSWWRGGLLAPGGDGAAGFHLVGIGVHVAGTLWLVAVVVADVWWPERDPVAEERAWPVGDRGEAQLTTTWSNDVVV